MIKVTKEAIVTSPFDAVADAPSEWGDAPMYWGDEDDLTWLAKNMDEWVLPYSKGLKLPDDVLLHVSNNRAYWSKDEDTEGGFTKDQWLQRRRELGLEANHPEIQDSSQPDWDTAPKDATNVLMHRTRGTTSEKKRRC